MPASDDTLLMVRIEAQISKFERAMAKASGTATSTARKIETDFRRMDRNLASIGGGFVRGLLAPLAALASGREIGQAADAFTRIQNALRIVGLEGEAAAAVFDRLFASAQKNAAPVEALVNVYRAGALAQKELRVTSEELIRFTEGIAAALRVSGRSAEESRGALLQLSQAIGSGIVRAEEFNAILEGALPIAQAAARGLEEAGGSVAKLRTLIIDGKVSSEAFFRAFEAGQETLEALAATADITLGGAFTKLQNSLIASIGRFNETFGISGAVAEQFDLLGRQIDSLIGAFLSLAQPVEDIDARFRSIINSINGVAEAIGQFTGLGNVGTALGITSEEELRIQRASETAAAMRTDLELAARLRTKARQEGDLIAGPAGPQRTVSLKDFAAPSKTGSHKKTPGEKFERDIETIRARTLALEADAAAVGKSTFAAEKLRAVQDLLNEAHRAGVKITPELTAQIDKEAEAYARAAATLEQVEQRHEELLDLQNFMAESLSDVFTDIVTGAATAEESLKNLVAQLVQAALQAALLGKGPLAALFGGGPTGGAPGGAIGSIIGSLFGARGGAASGGFTLPSMPSLGGARAAPIVRLSVVQGQMFEPVVQRISGNVAVQTVAASASMTERRILGQVSGHLAEQQRAY